MEELKSTTDMVEVILMADPKTRSNDNLLYIRLVDMLGRRDHIDYIHMPMIAFYEQLPTLDVPTIETVSRLRRKAQQKNPELKATEAVENFRAEREEMFRAYARS